LLASRCACVRACARWVLRTPAPHGSCEHWPTRARVSATVLSGGAFVPHVARSEVRGRVGAEQCGIV
jgi:hypothetical protein